MDGKALEFVPKELKTLELCFIAVETGFPLVTERGPALKFVPEELKTPKLCLAALARARGYQNGVMSLTEYIPKEFKTKTPKEWLTNEKMTTDLFGSIDDAMKTRELCLAALRKNGSFLRFDVPKDMLTPEMCLVAVQNDGTVLEFVPSEYITPKMCLVAVQNNGSALKYVPNELITLALCFVAVQTISSGYNSAFWSVPEKFKTAELCLAAVQNTGEALEIVPEELKTPELCFAAIQESPSAFAYVPKEFKTPKFWNEVIHRFAESSYYGGTCFKFIEDTLGEMAAEEIYLAAKKEGLEDLLFVGNFDEKDDKNVDGPDVTGWALTDDEKVAFKGWATGEPEEGW